MSARAIYRNLARLVGLLLLVVGALALYGGHWSHNFVSDQLRAQRIDMPAGAQLTTDDMKSHLSKYSGKQMSTGPEARAFADHYIAAHMNAASGGKTFEEVSGPYLAQGRANPKLVDGTAPKAELDAYKKLGALREELFMGNSLRGMLLTAYAWWTVGTIAEVVGWTLLGVGLLMCLFSLLGGRRHAAAEAAPQGATAADASRPRA